MSKFMNRPPPTVMSSPLPTNNSTFVEKLMIGLDHAPAAFDLRGQMIGAGGANLNYIRNETGANATLRGRGSMFIDPSLGAESQEPMHLYIEHSRFDGLQNAKQLAKNLIETLQQELVHFQQMNPPVPASVQYSQQPVQTIQNATQVISAQPNVIPQMSIPPPMLAVPPPQIQSAPMVQSNIITQNAPTMVTASTTQIQPGATQPQIIQQQTLIPTNGLPIQLQRGNMVIQQPMQSNLSVPPPNMTMKPNGQIVSQVQLSQPPPNIQIPQQNPIQTTQIVLNQPPVYLQQANPDPNQQQNQVTIQHIYQPQRIVQTQPINQFAPQQTAVRQSQPQQYIVQGNTTYSCITAVPPPNIIQHQPPPHQMHQQQNIIFQTTANPPNQMPLQQLQLHHAQSQIMESQSPILNGNETDNVPVKEEKSTPEPSNESPIKSEEKSENENHIHESPSLIQQHQQQQQQQQQQCQSQTQHQPQIPMNMPPPIQFTQAPIMAVPPPMTCVQHIVSQPTHGGQTHQVYNQIPVSMQDIQAAQSGQPQQIHVTSGQHILVNAPQYQTQQTFQQIPQNLQSFQITTTQQPRSTQNEIVMLNVTPTMNQPPDIRTGFQTQPTGAFNPHMVPPPVVQFQPMQQQVIQTIDTSQPPHQQQIIEQQHHLHHHHHHQHQQHQQQHQHQQQQPQHQFQLQPFSVQNIQTNPPHPGPFPQQKQVPQERLRMPLKRKRCEDDNNQPPKHMMAPRIGMGSNNGGHQQQAQQFINSAITTANTLQTSTSLSIVSSTAATMTTTNNQDEPISPHSSGANYNHFKPQMSYSDGNEQFYRTPPISVASTMMHNGMPPRGPPRFTGNVSLNRMNFGPPPPPPPLPHGQRPRYMHR